MARRVGKHKVSTREYDLFKSDENVATATTYKATDYISALGGVYVGADSDPGTDNLVVDGATTLSGTLAANGHITIGDSINILTNTSTGTKIGTATGQKIGFYNATPVVQQAGAGETTGFTAGSGTAAKSDSTFTGNVGSAAYTVGDVVKALKNLGLMAS